VLADRASRVTNLTVPGVGPYTHELSPGEAMTWIDIEQLDHVLDLAMERPAVRLSFDGGNCSDVHIALPRLVERGLTAEFFPLAGRIGDPGRIDRSGLRELVAAGMPLVPTDGNTGTGGRWTTPPPSRRSGWPFAC
jgi:hypothetical protein